MGVEPVQEGVEGDQAGLCPALLHRLQQAHCPVEIAPPAHGLDQDVVGDHVGGDLRALRGDRPEQVVHPLQVPRGGAGAEQRVEGQRSAAAAEGGQLPEGLLRRRRHPGPAVEDDHPGGEALAGDIVPVALLLLQDLRDAVAPAGGREALDGDLVDAVLGAEPAGGGGLLEAGDELVQVALIEEVADHFLHSLVGAPHRIWTWHWPGFPTAHGGG